jgi:hypothetical protein
MGEAAGDGIGFPVRFPEKKLAFELKFEVVLGTVPLRIIYTL